MPESIQRPSMVARSMLLTLALALAPPALAHKLKVFAFAEGDRIQGSAYFVGGAKASGASILIQDDTGQRLATLTPDSEGRFSYRVLQPVDHLIVALGADGHRAEWRVSAAELAGAFPSTPQPDSASAADDARQAHDTQPPQTAPVHASATDPALMAAIEQSVARQIRPLREQLIALDERIRLQDILGGIGYILGLTGLALWWRRRKTGESP